MEETSNEAILAEVKELRAEKKKKIDKKKRNFKIKMFFAAIISAILLFPIIVFVGTIAAALGS